jgi:hypothetical protein
MHPIGNPKSRSLESNLGQTPDVTEAAVLCLGLVPQEFNLNRNATCRWVRNLSGKQPIVRTGRRTHDLPNLALSPFITPEEAHFRRRVWLNLLELPFWKIHDHKSTRAVRKVENGLSFRHRGAWAG